MFFLFLFLLAAGCDYGTPWTFLLTFFSLWHNLTVYLRIKRTFSTVCRILSQVFVYGDGRCTTFRRKPLRRMRHMVANNIFKTLFYHVRHISLTRMGKYCACMRRGWGGEWKFHVQWFLDRIHLPSVYTCVCYFRRDRK